MFRLLPKITTAAPATSARMRRITLEQIASGKRVQPSDLPQSEQTRSRAAKRTQRWRSLAAARPEMAAQLHPLRNDGVDPGTIAPNSHRLLWWRCSKCGHEWEASPHDLAGRGCPACGRRRTIAATILRSQQPAPPGRSLAAKYPELLTEWHPTRNPNLDPQLLAPGSERKAWWRCIACGHEWVAAVRDRTRMRPGQHRRSGCPVCALSRRAQLLATAAPERSLGTLYPGLLAEWHPSRNADLDPLAVNPGSERKVWWLCAECGCEWSAAINVRCRSPRGGCARCARSRGQRERRSRERGVAWMATGT
jgi:ssDNA-binding Zn-finger/Zn-ribbon topoisomerase 1